MVGGVNDSRRASQFPRCHPLGRRSGIPREPISHTPKTHRSGTRFAAKPGLNRTPRQPVGTTRPDRSTLPHVCAAGHAFRGGGRRGRRGRRYFSRRGRRRDRRAGRSRQPAEVASRPAQRQARGWRQGDRIHAGAADRQAARHASTAQAAAARRTARPNLSGPAHGRRESRGEGGRGRTEDRRQHPPSPSGPLRMPRTGYKRLR